MTRGVAGASSWPSRQLLWLAAGFGIWFSALVCVYALHAIGCAFGWPASSIQLGLALILAAHLALIGGLWWRWRVAAPIFGRTGRFLRWVILGTLASAVVKIAFTLGPVLVLSACL